MSTPPQAAPAGSLVLDHRENGVAVLTLNRPDRLNALNKDLAVALNAALTSISTDKYVSVVVLTGAGRAFVPVGTWPLSARATKTMTWPTSSRCSDRACSPC